MKWNGILVVIMVLALASFGAVSVLAQEATPEATPEATLEATPEATEPVVQTLSEIFAGLPQERTADGGFVVGQPDAPITIIEFSDFACPHCQNYRPVIDQVIHQYVAEGKAKFELRIMPTAGGQLTAYVSQVVECASHQQAGAFWQSYEILYDYATTGQYTAQVPQQLSDALGLNYDKLMTCTAGARQVVRDITLAQYYGVMGTPAVMVRYGDGEPEFITLEGRTFSQGGPTIEVLAAVIEAANTADAA